MQKQQDTARIFSYTNHKRLKSNSPISLVYGTCRGCISGTHFVAFEKCSFYCFCTPIIFQKSTMPSKTSFDPRAINYKADISVRWDMKYKNPSKCRTSLKHVRWKLLGHLINILYTTKGFAGDQTDVSQVMTTTSQSNDDSKPMSVWLVWRGQD